jgi:hypothetical protein
MPEPLVPIREPNTFVVSDERDGLDGLHGDPPDRSGELTASTSWPPWSTKVAVGALIGILALDELIYAGRRVSHAWATWWMRMERRDREQLHVLRLTAISVLGAMAAAPRRDVDLAAARGRHRRFRRRRR